MNADFAGYFICNMYNGFGKWGTVRFFDSYRLEID